MEVEVEVLNLCDIECDIKCDIECDIRCDIECDIECCVISNIEYCLEFRMCKLVQEQCYRAVEELPGS